MLIWNLKGITYILDQNDSLLKGNYFKEVQLYCNCNCLNISERIMLKHFFYLCKWTVGLFDFARLLTMLVLKQLKRTYMKTSTIIYNER